MTHILSIRKLFEELEHDLEERLNNALIPMEISIIEFNTPYGKIKLGINGGEVILDHEEEPTAKIFFDLNAFTRIIFGLETISELMFEDMVRIHTAQYIGRIVSTVQTLFPKKTFFISPIDHW